jgi:C_GCAxxG_C_C family probable redox protein
MTYAQKAAELHASKKYNCAQAVAMAFADKVDLSEDELSRLGEAFGSGGGNMEGTCGAIAGAQMIIGLMNSCGTKEGSTRSVCYKKSRRLMEDFKAKNGSVICKELKGIESGKVLRDCRGCVADAAEILEKIINEGE